MNTTPNPTEADAIAQLAMAGATPDQHAIDGALILTGAYPAGWHHVVTDLEQYEAAPRRAHGTATFLDTASLLEYIAHRGHAGPGSALPIYLVPRQFRAVAVFNDHEATTGGWRDDRAVLELQATDEWVAWTGANKSYMPAAEFAEFVEEWRHTIADPPTLDVVDMARSFRATTKVTFGDEVVEQSGDRALTWTTETTASAGRSGKLEIPTAFTLVLAPFDGAELHQVTAQFRYRVNDGRAYFGVVLDQPNEVAKRAFLAEVDKISDHGAYRLMVGRPAQ